MVFVYGLGIRSWGWRVLLRSLVKEEEKFKRCNLTLRAGRFYEYKWI